MKFENLYICCESIDQVKDVKKVLEESGYKLFSENLEIAKSVVTFESGLIATTDYSINDLTCNYKNLNFDDFMREYNKNNGLEKKINQAKKDLGLSNNGLAAALGYSKPYITKVLNKLPGDKVQKRLIGDISWLLGENRASGSGASQSINMDEIIKQKDLKIAKHDGELFWSSRVIKSQSIEIEKLQSKIQKDQILFVVIFAVMLAIFLASHAI